MILLNVGDRILAMLVLYLGRFIIFQLMELKLYIKADP